MRKHWFKLVLLILAVVCGIAVWALLDTLWNNMVEYEANSEIGAVTEYFQRFAAGDYDTAADTAEFPFDEKNPREDYIRYLKETFGSDFSDLRFAGREGDVPGEKLYRIYAGNTPLGSVRLVPVTGQSRNWKVISQVEYADPVTVVAPAFVKLSANGVVQTPSEAVSPVAHEDFAALETVISVPLKVTYTLDGYLYEPQISATVPDGTVCPPMEQEDGTVEFSVAVSENDRETFEGLMTDFSKLYARFISKDASFASLKPKMLQGTTFYSSVRTFDNGWYVDHTGYEFRNLTVSDLIRADENTFAGTIRFDHVVFRGTKEYVYPSAYRLSFCLSEGQWLLADLKIL